MVINDPFLITITRLNGDWWPAKADQQHHDRMTTITFDRRDTIAAVGSESMKDAVIDKMDEVK